MNLRTSFSQWLMRQWQTKGWFCLLMRPLEAISLAVVRRKKRDYASGQRIAEHPGVPVIVVGNVFVGGTGKTPVVIAIAHCLQGHGYTPGILSRGYGVDVGGEPRLGQHPLDPAHFGDEPALIAQRSGAPLAVHPSRVRAAHALLTAFPEIDVLISDDGLQHLALARDLEIVVQDERGVGNGHMLPAGPLREPAERLDGVDIVITNRASLPAGRDAASEGANAKASATSTAATKVNAGAQTASAEPLGHPSLIDMHMTPDASVNLDTGDLRTLEQWAQLSRDARVVAAAGIGQPERFFSMLQNAGIRLHATLALPDHHDFKVSPFADLDADYLLVTAKDGVKCRALKDPKIWEVPVQAVFTPSDFPDSIVRRLHALPTRRSRTN